MHNVLLCGGQCVNMAKATKTIRLPIDVAERLEEEDNQSVTVEEALREWYGIQ